MTKSRTKKIRSLFAQKHVLQFVLSCSLKPHCWHWNSLYWSSYNSYNLVGRICLIITTIFFFGVYDPWSVSLATHWYIYNSRTNLKQKVSLQVCLFRGGLRIQPLFHRSLPLWAFKSLAERSAAMRDSCVHGLREGVCFSFTIFSNLVPYMTLLTTMKIPSKVKKIS